MYIVHRISKRVDVSLIQLYILNNDINFQYKIDSFYVVPQILAEKIIIDLTIKDYFDPRILGTDILKLFLEGKYELTFVCDKSAIAFGTRKFMGLCNTFHVESIYIYSIETIKLKLRI